MKRIVASGLALAILMLLVGALSAWAGNCGGAGPACVCGDTVTANHILPGPLTCPGDGLIVDANIVLDLGGHDLTGTEQGGFGVQLNTSSQVKNGRIQNFGTGIESASTIASCKVGDGLSPLVVTINDIGINLDASKCAITKATIVANDSDGVKVTGGENTLTQNTCSRNGGDGISIIGDKNVLTGNRCELNDANGIAVDGNVNTLERNLAGRNDQSGIIANGDGNVFRRNQGRTNLGDGVRGMGTNLDTDGRNYGTANEGTDCLIDGSEPTGGGHYC